MENNDIIEEVIEIPAEEEKEAQTGCVNISTEVVATIAGIAAGEIDGVAGMYGSFAGGIADIFTGKKNPTKGVKVDVQEKSAVIDLYLIVDFGVRIPELAWNVQENVKNNIETMTGLSVERVNIHVEGVSFEKEKETPKEEILVEEAEMEDLPEDQSEGL